MPTNQRSQVVAVARTAKNANYINVKKTENTATYPRHPQRERSNAGLVSGRTRRTRQTAPPTKRPSQAEKIYTQTHGSTNTYGGTRAWCAYERY